MTVAEYLATKELREDMMSGVQAAKAAITPSCIL